MNLMSHLTKQVSEKRIHVCNDLVLIFLRLTIAKKNREREVKLITAKTNSKIEDSISGRKRSNLDPIVRIANNANAAETKRSLFDLKFL